MKIWKSFYSFDYPWDVVTRAACRKYPNPHNPSVLSTDIIDRKVVDGVLYSHKLVSSNWIFPDFATALVGPTNICYGSEKSEVDPAAKQMIVRTKNITFPRYVDVRESLKYVPDPENPNKTLLVQEATISIEGLPFTDYMENRLMKTMANTANKGREAIEWIIQKMDNDLKESSSSMKPPADDLLQHTKHQFQGFTEKTKRTMDDIQNTAFQNLNTPGAPQ